MGRGNRALNQLAMEVGDQPWSLAKPMRLADIDTAVPPIPQHQVLSPFVPRTAPAEPVATVFDASDELERLVPKAMREMAQILDEPLIGTDPNFAPLLRAKTSIAHTTLATQVKVDENRLKRRGQDMLPALLSSLKEESRKIDATRALLNKAASDAL